MQDVVEISFLDIEEKQELKEFAKQVVTTCFGEEKLNDLNFYLNGIFSRTLFCCFLLILTHGKYFRRKSYPDAYIYQL